MKIILLIGAGSFIGGISRYLLSQLIQPKSETGFPYGTLSVNLIGCLLIGIVFGIAEKGNMSTEVKMFLAAGVLGGFTTFSAFSNQTFGLMSIGQYGQAIAYVLTSVLLGLVLTFFGYIITRF